MKYHFTVSDRSTPHTWAVFEYNDNSNSWMITVIDDTNHNAMVIANIEDLKRLKKILDLMVL